MIVYNGHEMKTKITKLRKRKSLRGGATGKRRQPSDYVPPIWKRNGKYLLMPGATVEQRIAASIVPSDDGQCAIWIGPVFHGGPIVYSPHEGSDGKTVTVVRVRPFLWRLAGKVVERTRIQLHATCKNPGRCVALDHLSRSPRALQTSIETAHAKALIINERVTGIRLWKQYYSDKAIGEKFGVSREWVRQVLTRQGLKHGEYKGSVYPKDTDFEGSLNKLLAQFTRDV